MILQRTALYPQMRLDVPDARAIEAFGQNDWIYFIKGVLTNKSLIVAGFDVTNYQNIFTVPGVQLSQNNVALLHPEASTQAAGFYISSGTEADFRLVLSSNNAGLTTNYVEADLSVTTGSPDVRAFWDSGANGGQGAEFTDTVDTVINLNLSIDVNISGFTAGRIPLYKIITNPDGTVNTLTDSRPMLFRLGSGGTSPDPDSEFQFPELPDAAHTRLDTPVSAKSATLSNAPFQGGDKNIKTLKQWMDAVMTLIKESNAVPTWMAKPQTSLAGAYQNAAMTMLKTGTFEHLTGTPGHLKLTGGSVIVRMGQDNSTMQPFSNIDLTAHNTLFVILSNDGSVVSYSMGEDNATPIVPKDVTALTSNSMTVGINGNYETSGGNIMVRGQTFAYTAYNSGTGLFSGVSPDPQGLVQVGDTVYKASDGGIGYYHVAASGRLPGVVNGISEGAERTFWLAYFDGVNTIFIRDSELVPGESAEVGDDASEQLYQYIGSSGAADNFPIYGATSIPDGTDLTDAIGEAFSIMETPIYDEKTTAVASNVNVADYMPGSPVDGPLLFGGSVPTYALFLDGNNGTPPFSAGANAGAMTTARWIGNNFIIGSTMTLGQIQIAGGAPLGTPTGDVYIDVFPSDGSDPNGPLIAVSDPIAANTIFDNQPANFSFSQAGFPVLPPGNYCFLARGTTDDGLNAATLKSPSAGYTANGQAVTTNQGKHSAATAVGASTVTIAANAFWNGAGGTFYSGSNTFTYSSYNGISGVLSGVSPSPVGLINIGDDCRHPIQNIAHWQNTSYQIYYQVYSSSLAGGAAIAQSQAFVASLSANVTNAVFLLKKIGSPNFQYIFEIRDDDGTGKPNSTVLASSVTPQSASGLSAVSFAQISTSMNPQASLINGQLYHLVIKETGSPTLHDDNNTVVLGKVNGNPYASGNPASSADNGVNWVSNGISYDLWFDVNGTGGGLFNGDVVFLPMNQKTSTPGAYTMGTDELEIYENGVLLQNNYDYVELTNNSIQLLRDIWPGSYLRFRIASVGGAGAASGGGPSGTNLQAAYANGRTITVASAQPVVINGPAGQKLLHVQGDVQIDGLLDPTGIELTPQISNPIPAGKMGFWIETTTQELMFTRANGSNLPMGNLLENLQGDAPNFARTMTNNTGATIAAGTPVYMSDTNEIAKADADDEMASRFFGITTATAANGAEVDVIFSGVVPAVMSGSGLPTNTRIWLTAIPGVFADQPPTTPGSYQVQIGLVCGNDLILQIQNYGQVV